MGRRSAGPEFAAGPIVAVTATGTVVVLRAGGGRPMTGGGLDRGSHGVDREAVDDAARLPEAAALVEATVAASGGGS
ncbi:hypothetical protein [Micromonospora chersina]|uniref:hypothetical protein n=1 Tax=Micromonospora chersina TaxID=47854 RepID=UPI0036B8FCFD